MPVSYELVPNDAIILGRIMLSNSFRSVIGELPFTEKELLTACKSPIAVMKPKNDGNWGNQHYLNIAAIKINGIDHKLSYHLSCDAMGTGNCTLNAAFIVTDDFLDQYERSPALLFQACIDQYGVDIEIAGDVNRLYERNSVQLDNSFKLDASNINSVIKIRGTPGADYAMYYPVMLDADNVLHMEFLYGVDVTKYLAKLKMMFTRH